MYNVDVDGKDNNERIVDDNLGEDEEVAGSNDGVVETAASSRDDKKTGDHFSRDSDWELSYHDMLNSNGQLGKYIKWKPLQEAVSAGVTRAKPKGKSQSVGVAGLFGGIIRQNEMEVASSIYKDAPNDPSNPIVRTQAPKKKRRVMS